VHQSSITSVAQFLLQDFPSFFCPLMKTPDDDIQLVISFFYFGKAPLYCICDSERTISNARSIVMD